MNITVIGSGVYGLAITKLLLESNDKVTLWTEKKDFSDLEVPKGTYVTNSYEEAAKNADVVLVLTSSKFVRDVLKNVSSHIKSDTLIVLGSKGILNDGTLPIEIASLMIKNPCAVLSGPTFAKDIAALDPVGFTLACSSKEQFSKFACILPQVHLEYSSDVLGVEMAGSLKNAYAIGSGIITGLNYGFSTTCLYISRVLKEVETIFKSVGANPETVFTLAGVGDMVLTCTSATSRNFTFGTLVATKDTKKISEYIENTTVEGYENLMTYIEVFKKKGIETPILKSVYEIVALNAPIEALIKILKD